MMIKTNWDQFCILALYGVARERKQRIISAGCYYNARNPPAEGTIVERLRGSTPVLADVSCRA